MQFTVLYPLAQRDYDRSVITPQGVARIVCAAEEAGFHGIAFSEHPAPSRDWIETKGHHTFDLPAALGYAAALTSRIELMTYLVVLPYHHPFVLAKMLATLDLLSDGRLRIVVGAGYLKEEFDALNVPFEERNEIFDEALTILRDIWTTDTYSVDGRYFRGTNIMSAPRPTRTTGPPIIVGGNSARARKAAARNDGWSPVLTTPELASFRRVHNHTPSIVALDLLAEQIREVRSSARVLHGRTDLWIQVLTPQSAFLLSEPPVRQSVEEHRDYLGRLTAAGVDNFIVKSPPNDASAAADSLQRYAGLFFTA